MPHLRTGISLQQPTGLWSETFGYDTDKRLQSIASPASTFSYTYRSQILGKLVSAISLPPTGAAILNMEGSVR